VLEENPPEENGISNRHNSTTFIPPLTPVNGDAKVEENRRFEIPVVAARISAFGA